MRSEGPRDTSEPETLHRRTRGAHRNRSGFQQYSRDEKLRGRRCASVKARALFNEHQREIVRGKDFEREDYANESIKRLIVRFKSLSLRRSVSILWIECRTVV